MKKTLPALAALTLLAACASDEPAPPPPDNGVEMLDVTNEAMTVPEAPPTMNLPDPVAINAADEEPEPVDDREQIQADADATGMTARVNRDDEPATGPANETAPASVSEEK